MAIFTSYLETEGLKKLPAGERLAAYRKAHAELLEGDRSYREACRKFTLVECGLILLPTIPGLLRLLGIAPVDAAGSIFSMIASLLCLVLFVVTLSQAQHFRNMSIAAHLNARRGGG